MKKIVYISLVLLVLSVCLMTSAACGNKIETKDCVRIHVRANSNSDADQSVKMKVVEKVVEYLSPRLAACRTPSDAKKEINAAISEIEKVANGVLAANGKKYTAKATLKREKFPTRNYDGINFSGGVYDALIVELGTGSGDNWWCVAFPPLCFVPEENSENFRYRSLIVELIRKFKEEQ